MVNNPTPPQGGSCVGPSPNVVLVEEPIVTRTYTVYVKSDAGEITKTYSSTVAGFDAFMAEAKEAIKTKG